MRTLAVACTIALGLAACSGREPLAPLAAAPECGDGVPVDGEVCLRSFAVEIPYAFDFMARADAERPGDNYYFTSRDTLSYTQLSSWAFFYTPLAGMAAPELVAWFEFADHQLYRPVLVDMDGDGRTDILSPAMYQYWGDTDIPFLDHKLEFWHSHGGYRFELHDSVYNQNDLRPSIAIGDIDGDARPDALIANNTAEVWVWTYNAATEELKLASSLDLEELELVADPVVVAADFNGDAHADFVLADGAGRVWWLIGGPEHRLSVLDPKPSLALGVEPITLLARDFDGDDLVDLAAVRLNPAGDRDSDTISLARGLADGRFEPLATFETDVRLTYAALDFFTTESSYAHLGLFDLDGSGELALVYAHDRRPELVVHPRIGRTLGDEPILIPLEHQAHSFFVDDLDGDGEDSIYVAIGEHVKVDPGPQAPNGWHDTYWLVRFDPDP